MLALFLQWHKLTKEQKETMCVHEKNKGEKRRVLHSKDGKWVKVESTNIEIILKIFKIIMNINVLFYAYIYRHLIIITNYHANLICDCKISICQHSKIFKFNIC